MGKEKFGMRQNFFLTFRYNILKGNPKEQKERFDKSGIYFCDRSENY